MTNEENEEKIKALEVYKKKKREENIIENIKEHIEKERHNKE